MGNDVVHPLEYRAYDAGEGETGALDMNELTGDDERRAIQKHVGEGAGKEDWAGGISGTFKAKYWQTGDEFNVATGNRVIKDNAHNFGGRSRAT